MLRRARLLCAALAIAACGPQVAEDGSGDATGDSSAGSSVDSSVDSTADSGGEEGGGIQLAVNKDVDILFVIDNSGSMGAVQGLLSADFPAFIDVLDAPDVRASYRIGVTTTDNGNPWCGTTTPESGELQFSSCRGRTGEFVFNGNPPMDATAACTDYCQWDEITTTPTVTEYDHEPRPRPWLESSDGITNLADDFRGTPTAAEAFQCFGPQGVAGCGFESHLESMYKAMLRASSESAPEYGFLRAGAILAVVIVSDEGDCSYNSDYESIFLSADQGGNPVFWSDPTSAAPTSAVCWNAGVSCDGGPGTYDTCYASNKDVDGNVGVADDAAVLQPISRYVDFLQELEDQKREINPDQEVVFSLITGVPPGYDQGLADLQYADALDPAEQETFGIGAGCVNNAFDPPYTARPPVREREVAEAFQIGAVASDRNVYSICADDYSPALNAIANAVRDQIKPACMPACVADVDPIVAGLQPSCTLSQTVPLPDGGGLDETAILPCNADGSVPDADDVCYIALVNDLLSDYCADQGWNLEFRIVRRAGVPAAGGTSIAATCQLSQNKPADCPELP